MLVRQARRAGSRIDRYGAYEGRNLGMRVENAVQHNVQTLQIVLRMLAETALGSIAVETLLPTLVGVYRLGNLLAAVGIDQHGTNGIRAVVEPDNKIFLHIA